MSIDTNELLALSAEEKLRVIETLWDNLSESGEPFPLSGWMTEEGLRRRDEMRSDPEFGLSHEEVWKRIDELNDRRSPCS